MHPPNMLLTTPGQVCCLSCTSCKKALTPIDDCLETAKWSLYAHAGYKACWPCNCSTVPKDAFHKLESSQALASQQDTACTRHLLLCFSGALSKPTIFLPNVALCMQVSIFSTAAKHHDIVHSPSQMCPVCSVQLSHIL